MFTGSEITHTLVELGISHVIWIPDSDMGPWERELEAHPRLHLLRVCREGEAWPLAAGLLLGGKSPLIVMQTTGLFESGDALRNILYDLHLPVFALIGARSYLQPNSTDSARRFAIPILDAWQVDYVTIANRDEQVRLRDHYRSCRERRVPGVVLMAE